VDSLSSSPLNYAGFNKQNISSRSWAGAYPWVDKENHVYGFFLAQVASQKYGFAAFFASPILPHLVRDELNAKKK
jgi:serine-type D-Ala-D-Ala carboxypeptidase